MKIVSKAQQKFFGAVASGRAKKTGLKPAKAMQMLKENRGMKLAELPERKAKRSTARRPSERRAKR